MCTDAIVCVGDYSPTNTPKAQRGGAVPYASMTRALSRVGVVLNVREPYSSMLSPTTSAPVRLAEQRDTGMPPRHQNRLFVLDGSRARGGIRTLMLDR